MPIDAISRYSPYALTALRIMTGLLFIPHGTQKLFAWPASEYFPEPLPLFSLMGVAGVLESIGGLLIVLGLLTRPVAFELSGFMAAAYFMGHAPQGFFPAVNGGDAAILFCFVYFYLFFAGPGALSLDGMLRPSAVNRPAAGSA